MILSLALQVEHVLLFEFRVFSFGKICFILSLTQKNIAVVKRGDKPHIYQIAPVGLEKAVYRQQTAPVLHRAGRGKGTVRGVDRYHMVVGFQKNNIRHSHLEKAIVRCFHQDRLAGAAVNIQCVQKISVQPADFQRLGQIAEHMKTHGVIQILRKRSNHKDDRLSLIHI